MPIQTLLLSSILTVFFGFAAGCPFQSAPPTPTGGGMRKISPTDIPGRTMWYIRNRDLAWTFAGDQATLENKGDAIPNSFVAEILGEGETAQSLSASWELIDDDATLRLFDLKVDGKEIDREVNLPIIRAGNVRVNIGAHQYNNDPTERYEERCTASE